ncbi:Thrombospondin type 3 repeat family [Cyanobium sp. PCC 7001]|nr:Thrombospondin type 3 repeat family [Cyanobium sp. PCC 7001]
MNVEPVVAVRALAVAIALVTAAAPALGQTLPPKARVQADTDGDGQPDCTLVIPALGYRMADADEAAQASRDVLAVKRALEQALQGSADMRSKLAEACSRERNGRGVDGLPPLLEIFVWRDHPAVGPGSAHPARSSSTPGSVVLDLGDIEATGRHFTDEAHPELAREVTRWQLTRILAHELDHLRDPPDWGAWGSRHGDPRPEFEGEPVRDENAVIRELGGTHRRTAYGSDLIPYQGTGDQADRVAVLRFKELLERSGQVDRGRSGQSRGSRFGQPSPLPVERLDGLPYRPCAGASGSSSDDGCYPTAERDDHDLDGIPDGRDRCPQLADPWQLDADGDGRGDACSPSSPPAPAPDSAPTQAQAAAPAGLEAALQRMRTAHGQRPFQSLPPPLQAEAVRYLQQLLEPMLSGGRCDHDLPLWQRFQQSMAATGALMPSSEVLACPAPAAGWDPARTVATWLRSPLHRSILLERPANRYAACLVGERHGRVVAACTLWRPSR